MQLLIRCRRFFPSTEPEPESDWEEVEGGESAENGPAAKDEETKDTEEVAEKLAEGQKQAEKENEEENAVKLPDVPTDEPAGQGPATKKQKPGDEEKL